MIELCLAPMADSEGRLEHVIFLTEVMYPQPHMYAFLVMPLDTFSDLFLEKWKQEDRHSCDAFVGRLRNATRANPVSMTLSLEHTDG